MQRYDIPNAVKPILPFIEDASNWYVRRSRRRFWKSGDDADKQDAYRTLHYVLVQLSIVMAPFTPFLAEELYRKLTGGESVHLLDWPEVGHVDELILDEMSKVREAITLGLSERAGAGIKVRQPLAKATLHSVVNTALPQSHIDEMTDIVREELNVKEVVAVSGDGENLSVEIDLTITPKLKREGIMREIVRHIQNARKNAGLNVDDRISLGLTTDDADVKQAIHEHAQTIKDETLANHLTQEKVSDGYEVTVKAEGAELHVSLKKV
jgi:isoleucyl-tRNA synthetase